MGVQLGNGMHVGIDFTPKQNCIRWLGQMSIWTISGVYTHLTDTFHLPWLISRSELCGGESLLVQGGMCAVWRPDCNHPG